MAAMPRYADVYQQSIESPERFWARAADDIEWIRRPRAILNAADPRYPSWFPGAMLNTCYNAVDLHVVAGHGERTALIYDSAMTGEVRSYRYADLQREVARLAGTLLSLGVERGDRVLIYMPMVPEAVIGMLACARIGAVHAVVFGGFAAGELAQRLARELADVADEAALKTRLRELRRREIYPYLRIDDRLKRSSIKLAGAGLALAVVLWLCRGPVMTFFEGWHQFRDPAALAALMVIGGGLYGAIVLSIFGRDLLKRFRAGTRH